MSNVASAAVAASLASGGVESVGFLNDIISQLWDYINVAGSAMTKEIVEPMFEELLPGPLKSLHFVKIDLGRKPIQFNNVDVHKRSEDVIKLDIDVAWDGECDIELKADLIGKLGVEHVKIAGRISVLLTPLINKMPIVTAVQLAFVNPPKIELDFTGLADLADLSVIDDCIRKVIQNVVASILVLPNRMLVKIDPTNDYFKTYQQQMGYLRLTVVNGVGLKTPKGFFKDTPDCFCKVRLGASEPWETTTKNNDSTPEWNETRDFLLSDHDQTIAVNLIDDDLTGDDQLGDGSITVGELLLAGKSASIPLKLKGADTGVSVNVKSEVFSFVQDAASFEAAENEAEGLMCGIITILIAGASNIPGDKKELGPSVVVNYGDQKFKTPMLTDFPGNDTTNPAFDSSFRIPLTSAMTAEPSEFCLTLFDHKTKMGSASIPFESVLGAENLCLTDKFPMGNGATVNASIRISGTQLAS